MSSWGGQQSLVLCGSPRSAEDVAAALAPELGPVAAFSDYGAAFDHAKKTRAVGFFLIADDVRGVPLDGAVAQLARPYETKGWPAFGALILTGAPAPDAAALLASRRLLSAVPVARLAAGAPARASARRLWEACARALEAELIPEALRATLLALAARRLPPASALFCERAAFMLCGSRGGAGLGWLEGIGAAWLPVFEALRSTAPEAVEANGALEGLCALVRPKRSPEDLAGALAEEDPGRRAAAAVLVLERARREGRLEAELDALERRGKDRPAPEREGRGDPLLRRLFYCRRRLLRLL